jgi:CubicO group peptidase (beta-lactamase class C family)
MCKPLNLFNYQATAAKDSEYTGTLSSVDNIVHDFMADNNVTGCAVGIVCSNQIRYLRGYGDARDNVDFRYFTPSSIGSISKTLTALGILVLYERGFLSLKDNISRHLPFVPSEWHEITIEQLLTHTSGLSRDVNLNSIGSEEMLRNKFPNAGNHPGIHPRYSYFTYLSTPISKPIGSVNYSNVGYMILGAIIDFITTDDSFNFGNFERGYENFIWWNIGMRGGSLTGHLMQSLALNAYWRQDTIPNIAYDHPQNGPDAFLNTGLFGFEAPAGGWTMTIGDLCRLMIMINQNLIITQETKQLMMENYGSFGSSCTGMGVFRSPHQSTEYYGADAFFHFGRIGYYDTRYTMWPDSGFGVAVMFNSRVEPPSHKALVLDLAGLHFEAPVFNNICSVNSIEASNTNTVNMNTELYRFLRTNKEEFLHLVELYKYRENDLEKGFKAMLDGIEKNGYKKFISQMNKGEFEYVARLANLTLDKLKKQNAKKIKMFIPKDSDSCCD